MDSKIPESLLDLQDALLSAQLRAVRPERQRNRGLRKARVCLILTCQ